MTKHFRATPKDGGEPIEFDLGDIFAGFFGDRGDICLKIMNEGFRMNTSLEERYMDIWLKDYQIYYRHEGNWYEMGEPKLAREGENDE